MLRITCGSLIRSTDKSSHRRQGEGHKSQAVRGTLKSTEGGAEGHQVHSDGGPHCSKHVGTHSQDLSSPRLFGDHKATNARLVDGFAGSSAISVELQRRGGSSSAYDIKWGCDLLDKPMQRRFEKEVLDGSVQALMLAPPC